jgi:hypothetical protein
MTTIQENYLIEKYKYILSRKGQLNEATFKIVSLYQIVVFAFAISFFKIYSSYKDGILTLDVGYFFCLALIVLFVAFNILILALLTGGVFAWLKYRRDENEIQSLIYGTTRSDIRFKNIFAWYEFYIILFIIAVCISPVIYFYINKSLLFIGK